MFTGLIEETGIFVGMEEGASYKRIEIKAKKVLEGIKLGDSISVNGICLTVTSVFHEKFTADIMPETVNRSSIGALKKGDKVNLERAMVAGGRFGGHIVSGHIDGTGEIESIKKENNAVWFTIKAKKSLLRYIVEKGSIAIDGMSLTIANVSNSNFSVSIIPHTMQHTNLKEKRIGSIVNLENDCIGKYVERLLWYEKEIENEQRSSSITKDFLRAQGFLV